MTRTNMNAVYDQIVSDLTEAKDLLSASYPVSEKIRINKWAATTVLARVYLYRKEYAKAEAEASQVLNSGMYSLAGALNQVFVPSSNEAILMFRPLESGSRNTSEGILFNPTTTGRPNFILTPGLLAAFEAGDQRRTVWAKNKTVSGTTYTYPYKYTTRVKLAGSAPAEYIVALRLAEVFLIRAEARNMQDNLAGAKSDVDTIRKRAGLLPTLAGTKAELSTAIEQEKRIEFFAEWGHRWLDLKRTGRVDAVMSVAKPTTWKPTAVLFPIPLYQRRLNGNLEQNPGYN